MTSREEKAAQSRMSYIDARRVWGILVNHAGAEDTDFNWVSFRQWFDKAFAKGGDEYRFIGSLGFGGKFWLHHRDGMYVTCYREDETPERLAAIEATNHALADLRGCAAMDAKNGRIAIVDLNKSLVWLITIEAAEFKVAE